ncbi:MAG TPA: hypothetical protein ENK82_08220 [Campylobacterales bacterium]|nr:hypothetical protein [Campylobacterales bacterium]
MSYKEQLKHEIEALVEKHPQQSDILNILHKVYLQALDESKKTGHSLSSMTYEILEALEEHHLEDAFALIPTIIYESAKERIEKEEKKLEQGRLKLIDIIELETLHLLESLETFHDYAQDNANNNFQQSLSKTKTGILERVNTFELMLEKYQAPSS